MPTPSSPRARRSPGSTDGHIKILAQAIETAAGMFLAGTFSGASARLIGLTWGAEDLSAELGAEANRDADGRFTEPYQLARSLCLFGAAAAQTCGDRHDLRRLPQSRRGLRRETEEARRDGFTGKIAIHPAQVAVINEVFTPTAEALAKARAIVAAFAAASGRRRGRHRRRDV